MQIRWQCSHKFQLCGASQRPNVLSFFLWCYFPRDHQRLAPIDPITLLAVILHIWIIFIIVAKMLNEGSKTFPLQTNTNMGSYWYSDTMMQTLIYLRTSRYFNITWGLRAVILPLLVALRSQYGYGYGPACWDTSHSTAHFILGTISGKNTY